MRKIQTKTAELALDREHLQIIQKRMFAELKNISDKEIVKNERNVQ